MGRLPAARQAAGARPCRGRFLARRTLRAIAVRRLVQVLASRTVAQEPLLGAPDSAQRSGAWGRAQPALLIQSTVESRLVRPTQRNLATGPEDGPACKPKQCSPMTDPRITKLAELLITHSTRLQKGEHVLIEAFDVPEEMVIALIKAARRAGGHPHVALRNNRIIRALDLDAADENLKVWADCDLHRMTLMQAYIGVRGSYNVSELAGIPDQQTKKKTRLYGKPVHFERRVNHTKWCVLRWPTPSMAQLAQMSTEAFEDFYFDVCTLDYGKMDREAQRLAERMRRTDRVRLQGPGETDLAFSIKNIPIIPCCG